MTTTINGRTPEEISFKSISYEEMRLEYFRKQRDSAERRMNYWCGAKQADRVGWMEASDRASEAGAQYNFYNDALEALEDNRFQYETGFVKGFESAQPKWISVEERLPDDKCVAVNDLGFMLIGYVRERTGGKGYRCDDEHDVFGMMGVTHWMPLPSTEGI